MVLNCRTPEQRQFIIDAGGDLSVCLPRDFWNLACQPLSSEHRWPRWVNRRQFKSSRSRKQYRNHGCYWWSVSKAPSITTHVLFTKWPIDSIPKAIFSALSHSLPFSLPASQSRFSFLLLFIQAPRYSFPGDLDVKPISPRKLEELLDDARSQFLLNCLFDAQSIENSRAHIIGSLPKRSVDVSNHAKERNRKRNSDESERNRDDCHPRKG